MHGGRSILTALRETADKIRKLEAEKKNILLEMEEIKKLSESKAAALESEVSALKEELASLRTLLGTEDDVSTDPPASKMEKPEKGKSKFNLFR